MTFTCNGEYSIHQISFTFTGGWLIQRVILGCAFGSLTGCYVGCYQGTCISGEGQIDAEFCGSDDSLVSVPDIGNSALSAVLKDSLCRSY